MKLFQKTATTVGIIILLFAVKSSYGQVYQGHDSRWYVGGSLGLNVGTVISISVMPEVAYAITEDLFVGGGIRYSYYKDNRYTPAYESTIWGGKLFTRYYVFDDVFLHIEAERLYFEDPYYNNITSDKWIYRNYFYGGGGYRQWIGPNSYMTIEILFDLTNNDYSFGTNPLFRMGFGVGL